MHRSGTAPVLTARKPGFDVDRFLAAHPTLRVDHVWHEGEAVRGQRLDSSGFQVRLASPNAPASNEQIAAELARNAEGFRALRRAGVDVVLDFGIFVGPGRLSRTTRFPAAFLAAMASLGIELAVSSYATQVSERTPGPPTRVVRSE